jgi:hypothetical protein
MAKYVMVAQSQALAGRDADYNTWYDNHHLSDICAVPGVKSGRRFELAMAPIGEPGLKYMAIFEVETDDPAKVMGEIGKRMADGTMKGTDALDAPPTKIWFYKQREK